MDECVVFQNENTFCGCWHRLLWCAFVPLFQGHEAHFEERPTLVMHLPSVPSISLDLSPLDVDDFTWEPPTEAETKVLQARRERQDRISRLMGDYLLRGYRMLGDTCADCGVRRVMRLRLRTRPQDLFSALSSVDPVSQAHLCPCTFWFPDDPPPR